MLRTDTGDAVVYAAFVLLPLLGASLLVLLARFTRRNPGRRRGWVLAGGNALVLLFLLSLVLLGAESYYRFWCDSTDWYGVNRISRRWLDRHFEAFASGYRDNVPAYTQRPAGGKRRITFLGDSFTAGYGIPNVDDRFANRIRKEKPEWEIHAVAVNGFDTGDEINTAQWLISQGYQFDEVVLVYCLNDATDMVPEWQAAQQRIYSKDNLGFLCTHSFCFNTWYYALKGRSDPDMSNYDHFVLEGYDGALWARQQERLIGLRNLIQANGGHLLVVTFPFLHKLGPGSEYAPVHKKLGEFWRAAGVPHLDLLGVYEPHSDRRLTVGSHDAHPNIYAHTLAADAIRKFLEQNITPKNPPKGG